MVSIWIGFSLLLVLSGLVYLVYRLLPDRLAASVGWVRILIQSAVIHALTVVTGSTLLAAIQFLVYHKEAAEGSSFERVFGPFAMFLAYAFVFSVLPSMVCLVVGFMLLERGYLRFLPSRLQHAGVGLLAATAVFGVVGLLFRSGSVLVMMLPYFLSMIAYGHFVPNWKRLTR